MEAAGQKRYTLFGCGSCHWCREAQRGNLAFLGQQVQQRPSDLANQDAEANSAPTSKQGTSHDCALDFNATSRSADARHPHDVTEQGRRGGVVVVRDPDDPEPESGGQRLERQDALQRDTRV